MLFTNSIICLILFFSLVGFTNLSARVLSDDALVLANVTAVSALTIFTPIQTVLCVPTLPLLIGSVAQQPSPTRPHSHTVSLKSGIAHVRPASPTATAPPGAKLHAPGTTDVAAAHTSKGRAAINSAAQGTQMRKGRDAQPSVAQTQAQSVDHWPTLETVPAPDVALVDDEIETAVVSNDEELKEIKKADEQSRSSIIEIVHDGNSTVSFSLILTAACDTHSPPSFR